MISLPHASCAYCTGPVTRRKTETLKKYNERRCCPVVCARKLAPRGIDNTKPLVVPTEPAPPWFEPDFSQHNLKFKNRRYIYMPILPRNGGSTIGTAAELCAEEQAAR